MAMLPLEACSIFGGYVNSVTMEGYFQRLSPLFNIIFCHFFPQNTSS